MRANALFAVRPAPQHNGMHRAIIAAATVMVMVIGLGGAQVATAQDPAPDPARDRTATLMAWRDGGEAVKAAAAAALIGTDADIQRFVTADWDLARAEDNRALVDRMLALSGTSLRQAGQRALAANNTQAIQTFLDTGWRTPSSIDMRVRINQIKHIGGTHVQDAAQHALDAENDQAYRDFLNTGINAPLHIDLRLRVNQVFSAGGPNVRAAAQVALDADTDAALAKFLDVQWPLQATRDQETATVSQLADVAQAASAQAVQETDAAEDAAAEAVAAAAKAKQQAEAARAAAQSAQGNSAKAAAAAHDAAVAANNAAAAAREALQASDAAVASAQRAAHAANQAAAAAAKAGQAASTAYQAAAKAATDANSASAARQAAQTARDAAAGARKAAQAADQAGKAADAAKNAVASANSAANEALTAYNAAQQAVQAAQDAGADAQEAIAAAQQAAANANRAIRAAAKASGFAIAATLAAFTSRDAANHAAADADAAAAAADAAADSAGQAADAAARATQHANAATAAAQSAVAAANQAQAIFVAARQADTDRLSISAEQTDQAALQAAAREQTQQAQVRWDAEQAAQRGTETNTLLGIAANPATEHTAAVAAARKAALALADDGGPWTREAALDALAGNEAIALNFARTVVNRAAGQDDRMTLTELAADGSTAMRTAATAALDGTDADVAYFLRNGDYPGRAGEDRLKVNQVMSAATAEGNTTVAARAQTALDSNDGATYRAFLDSGQFTALASDERVKVNQILASSSSGPEVKAAAQAALDGPSGYVHKFLIADRYEAAQRDQDTATHVAEVSSLLSRASAAATLATQKAYEAQATAATARGAAAEAAGYAQQAQQSAAQAAGYAQQAAESANQAQSSATAAIASADAARNAAATAQQAAKAAGRSAIWAQQSAQRAVGSANQAIESAKSAFGSAVAAGQDAQQAVDAYNAAYATVQAKVQEEQTDINRNYCYEHYIQNSPDYVLCLSKATESADEKLKQAYINSEYCVLLFPGDKQSPAYRNCLAMTFSPTFEKDIVGEFALAAGMEMLTFAAAGSAGALLFALGVGCVATGICEAIVLLGGELLAPGSIMLFLDTGGLTLTLGGLGTGAAEAVGLFKLSSLLETAWIDTAADDAALAKMASYWKGCSGCSGWRLVEMPVPGGAIGGGRWVILDEEAGAAIQQLGPETCWAACAEMITNGRLSQQALIDEFGEGAMMPGTLAREVLGEGWQGGGMKLSGNQTVEGLFRFFCDEASPWIAEVGPIGHEHYIIIDGIDDIGRVMIRDPGQGTSYRMLLDDFLQEWEDSKILAVFKFQ